MLDNDNIIQQVFQRQLKRSLQIKKIIVNAPLCCFALHSQSIQTADQRILWLTVEITVYLVGYIQ